MVTKSARRSQKSWARTSPDGAPTPASAVAPTPAVAPCLRKRRRPMPAFVRVDSPIWRPPGGAPRPRPTPAHRSSPDGSARCPAKPNRSPRRSTAPTPGPRVRTRARSPTARVAGPAGGSDSPQAPRSSRSHRSPPPSAANVPLPIPRRSRIAFRATSPSVSVFAGRPEPLANVFRFDTLPPSFTEFGTDPCPRFRCRRLPVPQGPRRSRSTA